MNRFIVELQRQLIINEIGYQMNNINSSFILYIYIYIYSIILYLYFTMGYIM